MIGRHGGGEEPTLEGLAAEFEEAVPLVRLLDSFGNAGNSEALTEAQDRCGQIRGGWVDVDARHEAPVDLDAIEGKFKKVRQAGVAGAVRPRVAAC